jgi:tRNA threonylcarbamoyladenosine biosynthesis protein TsaB
MILLLDTSSAVCSLTIINDNQKNSYQWQADRGLAKGLLSFLREKLEANNKSWHDIKALGVYTGPGSFTGLRIGIAVMNTIADANQIPIVGGSGTNWQDDVINKLRLGVDDKIVLPLYGSEARITSPKK